MDSSQGQQVRITAIDKPEDITAGFDVSCETLGAQTNDGIWNHFNPDWQTAEGRAKGASRMVQRWRNITKDKQGRPNTVFLKAEVAGEPDKPAVIAGLAIWVQESVVEGFGNAPGERKGLESMFETESDQRYGKQLDIALHKARWNVVRESESAEPPAILACDLCVVRPEFQGRGIATKLIQWGLDEAEKRGGMECVLEASSMGRSVYARLGFIGQFEIDYEVDEEFKDKPRPSNLFMRTRPKEA